MRCEVCQGSGEIDADSSVGGIDDLRIFFRAKDPIEHPIDPDLPANANTICATLRVIYKLEMGKEKPDPIILECCHRAHDYAKRMVGKISWLKEKHEHPLLWR